MANQLGKILITFFDYMELTFFHLNLHIKTNINMTFGNFYRYDNMADLYAVINTLQCLEKAYIKDSVTGINFNCNNFCSTLVYINFIV